MRFLKAFSLVVLVPALLCSTALLAQHSTVSPRITTDVNEQSLATLKGNVPRLARAEFDQGEASASTQLTHMRLVLSRSSEQQAALDAYLAQLQDKSSPNYHKWLTPEQFGQLYGPADSDIAALVAWLESHGFQVDPIAPGRTNIAFSGSVSQAEEAFHTSIHSYQAGDRQFFSNTADPQIPSALAPVVMGVAHLNTLRPRPHSAHGNPGRINSETKRLEPANATSPNLTFGSGTNSNPYLLYLVPADAATIYDTPNSFNANFAGGTSYTGAGVKIGIGGDAIINASIVETYRSTFLGSSYATPPVLNYCTTSSPSSCVTTPGSGYKTGDADEAYLDTELSGGLAPGATIYYYASPSPDYVDTAIDAAITANVVDIFSLSFGECELDNGATENALINHYWSQAAGQGIAVLVSAGDSGSAGCDYPSTNSGKNVPDATGGLAVSGYASTPNNIAVGGTDFYPLVNSFSSYVSESEGSTSTYYRTVKGYIPESTWNDSTYNNTTISQNEPLSAAGYKSSDNNIVAGSGGASTIYSRPTWQTGTGTFDSGGMRDLPDVSFMAGNGWYYAMWLVCDATYDCANLSESGVDAYGGTSTASPAFAGILALVQQKTGSRLGMPATELYGLYNGANSNSIFHDQNKVGNNSVPCTSALDGSCVKNAAGYYFESGYNTNTGYDMATGMGSVDATQLVNYWNSSTGSAPATVSFLSLSPNPVTTVQSLTVTVSVSGGSGTPTGTISLSGGSYNSFQTIGTGTCTSASSCVFTIPYGDLPIGSDTLTVTYGGNSTYAVATNTTSVTVNGLNAAVSITSPASGAGINSNQQLTVSGTVVCTGSCTGSTTPTGTVTLTGGGYTSPATALSGTGSYSITIPYNSLSAGSDTLTVTYNGSPIYAAGAFGTTSVTVTYVAVATPTVTVAPASGSIDSSQTYGVTVTVSGSSNQESSPTGTVTLSSGSYTSGPQTLVSSGSCTAAQCTIIIPANGLSNGTDTLTATYSGDADYASGTGTASVTVTKSAFALLATTPANIAPGSSATSTVTVSSSTQYTGTVTITCALTAGPTNTSGDTPSCMVGSTTVTLVNGVPTGTGQVTITVYTTAASAALAYPKLPGSGWKGAGGGAVLAFLIFLGIPARRRSWRSMLGVLIMMAALGSLAACGGGGGGGNPGTAAGMYTITVTGTGNPTVTPVPTTTFTVTVN
jgi:subtilase family serine protease